MSFAHLHICTTLSVSCNISYLILYLFYFFVIGCFMSTMFNCLHIPLCTVMLILIFNSTAYCHAHSFISYILFFISYFLFILFYVYFPCVVFFYICTVHGADPTLISLLVIQSYTIVVYVTNKTWNLKLVRPETPSDSWKQHWWCVQGRASEDVSVNYL